MSHVFRRAVTGLRWLVVGATVAVFTAVASLAVAGVTLGHGPQSRADAAVEWSLVADPGIDRQQAMDTAAAVIPGGRAVSAEFETERGTPRWEVEVVSPEGQEFEVTVDAETGRVVGSAVHD
ncbi:PepSY domain-containing protein [Nocardia sp. NPDC024068]|uniref:PepSY domain-containing protein n=1 Tax=Nocardia sp. NPDC024068 TaxID=3157197 RepID=UPI00340E043B